MAHLKPGTFRRCGHGCASRFRQAAQVFGAAGDGRPSWALAQLNSSSAVKQPGPVGQGSCVNGHAGPDPSQCRVWGNQEERRRRLQELVVGLWEENACIPLPHGCKRALTALAL